MDEGSAELMTDDLTAERSTAGGSEAAGAADDVAAGPEELAWAGRAEPKASVVMADGVTGRMSCSAVDSVMEKRRRNARLGLATTAQATTCDRGPRGTRSGEAR